MHSIPRSPEVVDFPRCNNTEIESFMRMPTDLPMVAYKVEMLLGQCEEVDATLEATVSVTDNQFPHCDGEECMLQ